MKNLISYLTIALFCLNISAQNMKPLAETPPMGWNSWDCFGMDITEDQVKATADYMAEHLKRYGWEYIVLDMGWNYGEGLNTSNFRMENPPQCIDTYGRLIPNIRKFPSSANEIGLKALADYIHSKGLKFGIHMMRGIPWQAVDKNTAIKGSKYKAQDIVTEADACNWFHGLVTVDLTKPGAQDYYYSLIEMYAEWGIDYIKADDMLNKFHKEEIEAIGSAINKVGRPIVLSLSAGPLSVTLIDQLRLNANLWRISGDMWDDWSYLVESLESGRRWQNYVIPNHWPDYDILPLGKLRINGTDGLLAKKIGLLPEETIDEYSRFTDDEKYTLMTLWSIFRSPLMIGGNLLELNELTLKLLTNREILEVNQKSCNNHEISFKDSISIWTADNNEKCLKYIAVINIGNERQTIVLPLENSDITKKIKVRDLWNNSEVEKTANVYTISIPPHGAGLYSVGK